MLRALFCFLGKPAKERWWWVGRRDLGYEAKGMVCVCCKGKARKGGCCYV